MKNRKKKLIAIILFLVVSLIIATILIIFYLSTDIFKSNQTLFLKYFEKNIENLVEIEKIFQDMEYEKKLKNSKYLEEIQLKFNYIEDCGTTSENTSNIINELKLTLEGQVDNVNKYNYKDIKLYHIIVCNNIRTFKFSFKNRTPANNCKNYIRFLIIPNLKLY